MPSAGRRPGPPLEPFVAGLAVNIDERVERRRQPDVLALAVRAEPLGKPDRAHVCPVDAVDDRVPLELVEHPVQDGDGAFKGVALALSAGKQAPSHLASRPAAVVAPRLPRADAPEPASGRLFDYR